MGRAKGAAQGDLPAMRGSDQGRVRGRTGQSSHGAGAESDPNVYQETSRGLVP